MKHHKPPSPKKVPHQMTIHGDTRTDDFYWLNDRENPEVIAYLEAENEYLEEQLGSLKSLRKDLYTEMISRIKQTDMSVPYRQNGYMYQTKYSEGEEYPNYVRTLIQDGAAEEEVLNVNILASEHSFYQTGSLTVSPNNQLLVFGEDTLSRRIYTLRFKDLQTGKFLSDRLEGTIGSAVWAADNRTVFYAKRDETLRPSRIYRHILGTSQEEDVEIYHEADPAFHTIVFKSRSGRYILIGSFSTLSTEYRILEATKPGGQFQLFEKRSQKHEYYIDHQNDRFLVRTNLEAENFRLMECSLTDTSAEHWKEVIGHRPDILLEDVEAFAEYTVLTERINGVGKIRIIAASGEDHYIDFEENAYMVYPTHNKEMETDTLRLAYTSLKTPNTTYDYDMNTRKLTLRKQQEVVGGYDPTDFVTDRLYATAPDGTSIPISIVYPKNLEKKGKAPFLLYGYGSYGHSIDPYFNSSRLSLLERGFGFAIAHIRGGEEMGRKWYESGKLLHKKNTFTDFIACAKHLIAEKYTSAEQLFAMGGSAGGLLMGAVINLAPELFKGVIAAVPFVDVVTTMLDESIPLTTGEFDEWGNPKIKEYYDYIKSYSPYDNVERQDYPSMLVTTGLHDSQVQYWEPAKWVAKLREYKTDNNLLLLYTNLDTGHSGASGRFRRYEETALEYAFLLHLAGDTGKE